MRKLCIIFMVGIVFAIFYGCKPGWLPRRGINNVFINHIDTLDGGCTYLYTVVFSDGNTDNSTASYWVGFQRINLNNGDEIVAYSDLIELPTPFNGQVISFALRHTANVVTGEQMRLIAVRGDKPGDLSPGTLSEMGVASDIVTAPAFPPRCGGFAIDLWASGYAVAENGCAFISGEPSMPGISAEVAGDSITGLADWTLVIKYTRSGRNDSDTYMATVSTMDAWQINLTMGTAIRGGQATLSCYARDIHRFQSMSFGIRAHNASENVIVNYINGVPEALWYYQYVAKHEGGQQDNRWYLQFNESYELLEDCGSAGVRYTPNSDGAGGFGIFQLTKFDVTARPPNAQELWDWKENVNSGTGWLTFLEHNSETYMNAQCTLAFNYGLAPAILACTTTVGSVTFVPPPFAGQTVTHAVNMKRYNGLGRDDLPAYPPYEYCLWNQTRNRWDFHVWAYYENREGNFDSTNYVERVCSVYP